MEFMLTAHINVNEHQCYSFCAAPNIIEMENEAKKKFPESTLKTFPDIEIMKLAVWLPNQPNFNDIEESN